MEIRLLESAKEDLREGWKFFDRNSAGLGEYFLECIQADVRSLKIYAGIHEMADGFHRMLAKRFPFAVYYLIENECVDIYAILDCRRDPEWIARRLDSSRQIAEPERRFARNLKCKSLAAARLARALFLGVRNAPQK